MGIWAAGVITHGQGELSARYQVEGLERSFTSPIEHEWGWVLDARPGDLWTEVHGRYAPHSTRPARPKDTPAAWRDALDQLQLSPRSPEKPWAGARPRIRFYGDARGPTLLIGLYGTKSVLYDPKIGVIVPEVLATAQTELELSNAREAPW